MFQFRRFPTYTYFIQCTLTEYCSAGFPHSEICGSKLMCSSPQLIAACRVLHRLLMPRHSPCALISLTFSRTTFFKAVLFWFFKNYAGLRDFVSIVVFVLPMCVLRHVFSTKFTLLPLCCLLAIFRSLHCSVFKVQASPRSAPN